MTGIFGTLTALAFLTLTASIFLLFFKEKRQSAKRTLKLSSVTFVVGLMCFSYFLERDAKEAGFANHSERQAYEASGINNLAEWRRMNEVIAKHKANKAIAEVELAARKALAEAEFAKQNTKYSENKLAKKSELDSRDDKVEANNAQRDTHFDKVEVKNDEQASTEKTVQQAGDTSEVRETVHPVTNHSENSVIKSQELTMPSSQTAFVDIVTRAATDYQSASNDMQRGSIYARRNSAICTVLKSKSVSNWVGTVYKATTNSDGKGVLELAIATDVYVTTWNNSFSDILNNTLIDPSSQLFATASTLSKGDLVTFSGNFFHDSENCLQEQSMTLRGKVREPEFTFRFSKIISNDLMQNQKPDLADTREQQEMENTRQQPNNVSISVTRSVGREEYNVVPETRNGRNQ